MNSLKDTFSKLKQSIVGISSTDIDAKLDSAVKDITSYKSHSGSNGYIELVRSVISQTGDFNLNTNQGGLFAQGSSPAALGQASRLTRYGNYDAIVYNINYCFRALCVLADNIMSPDDINKVSLEVIPQSYLEDEVPTESKTKYVEEALQNLKLEKQLGIIVKNTLKYGDFFVEIADAKTALTSQSILSEGVFSDNTNDDYKDIIKETIGEKDITFELDYTSFFDKKNSKNKDDNDIKNVHLLYHEPHRVVKLQSDMFPLCFGYLVFPKASYAPQMSFGDESVNNICRQLLDSLAKKIPQTKEFKNNNDLKDVVMTMIKGTDPNNQLVGIRYVPPDKVEHFHVPSTKFYPYGESIYESCSYTGKVLIAMETALAISRISRSTEKRKIQIEIGLPRDAAKAIEAMKEEFRKRKVSLDSFGSIDTIPCLDLETKIRMATGHSMTIGEIITQIKNGNKDMYVYSYNFENGKIFPNLITNATVSGRNVKVIKITLDNGEIVKCTPEHRWLLRNGSYKEARYLKNGDSLMPFYRKNAKTTNNTFITYEQILHPGTKNKSGKWELTHRAFSKYWNLINKERNICHHLDENPRNNHRKNLIGVNHSEHIVYHNDKCISSRKNKGGHGEILVESICEYCGEYYEHPYNICATCGKEECVKQSKILGGKNSWEIKKHQRKYEIIKVKCDWCEKEIKISRSVYKSKKNVNAGVLCKKKECIILHRTWSRYYKNNKHFCKVEFINCEECNKPITWSDKIRQLKVCSNLCSQTILSKRRWKDNNIDYSCDWCGKIFKASKKLLNNEYIACDKKECRKKIGNFKKSIRMLKRKTCSFYYINCKYCGESITVSDDPSFLERNVARSNGYCNIGCVNRSRKVMNHKVISVEVNEELIDVGDIEVEKFNNFGLSAGVFIHNSQISTFEDVYIPTKDGKPYVDINTFSEGNVDVRSKVDELKFLRDQLIASLGVPPSFLAIEENLSNKNALSEENILFARTIVNHQKYLSEQITELTEKILKIINPEKALDLLDNINVAFPPPKSLQFERESKYMSDVSNLIETLERIGIPKEYSKKKYLTQLDWDDVKKYEIEENLEKDLGTQKDEEPGMGGMGGMGM